MTLAQQTPRRGFVRHPHVQGLAGGEHVFIVRRHPDHCARQVAYQDHLAQRVDGGSEQALAGIVVDHHHLGLAPRIAFAKGNAGFKLEALDLEVAITDAIDLGIQVDIAVAQQQVAPHHRRGAVHVIQLVQRLHIRGHQGLDGRGAAVAKTGAGKDIDGVAADRLDVLEHIALGAFADGRDRHHRGDADDNPEHGQQGAHAVGDQRHPGHVERFLEQPQARHQAPRPAAPGLDRRLGGQLQADAVVGLVTDDLAITHLDDALGVRRNLGVVGDDNHRVPRRVQFGEDAHHLLAAVGVEGASGFVGQDHFTSVHQGPRNTHPLLLPAGQLAGPMAGVPRQAQACQQFAGAAMALALRGAGVDRRHLHVVQSAQVREQMVTLEDKPKVIAPQLRQLLIAQGAGFDAIDLVAAGGGVIQATEDVHQG